MQMSALQSFWSLQWRGDDLGQMSKFYHDLRVTADAAARGGQTELQLMEKLASVLQASVRLRPAFHAYAQHCRLTKMAMRFADLCDMVRDAVEDERRLVNERVLGQPSGRKQRDPFSPAGPATEPDEVLDVLRRNTGICQRWIVGKCNRGDSCRFKHVPVPAADAAEFKKACEAKFAEALEDSASEPGTPVTPGSAAHGSIGLCRNWEAGAFCSAMPFCRWRHGGAKEEHARVKALRAKGKGKGKGKAKNPSGAESSVSAAALRLGRRPA